MEDIPDGPQDGRRYKRVHLTCSWASSPFWPAWPMIVWSFGGGALYGESTKLPPVGRRPKQPTGQARTSAGSPVGLSRSLDQSLRKDLFSGLFQGAPTLTHDGAAHSAPVQSAVPGDAATPAVAESLSERTIRRIDRPNSLSATGLAPRATPVSSISLFATSPTTDAGWRTTGPIRAAMCSTGTARPHAGSMHCKSRCAAAPISMRGSTSRVLALGQSSSCLADWSVCWAPRLVRWGAASEWRKPPNRRHTKNHPTRIARGGQGSGRKCTCVHCRTSHEGKRRPTR